MMSHNLVLFATSLILLLSGCTRPIEKPLNIVYNSESFSFKLEEFEEGWEHLWGIANGPGFIQASGDIDDVFSQIFKDSQFESKPKWEGRYFKLTINYSGDKVEEEILNKAIEEIQSKQQISVHREQKTKLSKCLEIEDAKTLHLHIFNQYSGETESTSLTNQILQIKGTSLKNMSNYLTSIKGDNKYIYNGTDTNVYQFELDVADENSLSNSLESYGIKITECNIVNNVIIFD